MCDSDPASIDYFNKHLELMDNLGQDSSYIDVQDVEEFFNIDMED